MPAKIKFFDRTPIACNPYKEFWEFLEWLARRRQYPLPMHVWQATHNPQQRPLSKPMKFPGVASEAQRYPGADAKREAVHVFKRR